MKDKIFLLITEYTREYKMRIRFEQWIEENNVVDSAKNLFEESIICYKVAAYRSAFIMSYIAFQNVLKNKILKSAYIPSNMPQAKWNEINSKICDDRTWDEMITECVTMKKPAQVFLISDDIVKQYEYWRVIRNDCAHGKSNIISYSHIESFWLFTQAYYIKFVINGGMSGIMDIIAKHYDPSFTPANTDCTYIVENINNGVSGEEFDEFFEQLLKYYDDNIWGFYKFESRRSGIDLWEQMLAHKDSRIRKQIIKFMTEKSDEGLLFDFVKAFPNTASELLANTSFARLMWTKSIYNVHSSTQGAWIIVKKLINDRIIPNEELDEFNKKLYNWSKGWMPSDMIETLRSTDYFDRMKRDLFNDGGRWDPPNGIDIANVSIDSIIKYIKISGLDSEIAGRINQIFSFATYGRFYDGIRGLMKSKPEFLEEYKKIVITNCLNDYSEKLIED